MMGLFMAENTTSHHSCQEKLATPTFEEKRGAVVQWLALWTLNPEIRVQVSAVPYNEERVHY